MKKYNNFLLESISKKQHEYIDLVISYLVKNTNYDYFPYEEEFKVKKKNSRITLTGKLFLIPNDKAMRFNFNKYRLISIDMWEHFEFNELNIKEFTNKIHNKPTWEMNIPNSIMGVLDDIVSFINGDFKLNELKDEKTENNKKEENDEEPDVHTSPPENVELNTLKVNDIVFEKDMDPFETVKMFTAQVAFKVSNALVISGAAGLGKCLGKGTKVIMSNGELKNVEDVKKGESLMGPDSKPRKVLSINNGFSDLYEIQQNKGMNYIVNDEHILSLKKSINAKKKGLFKDHDDVINIPIKEYLNKSNNWKRNFFGYKVEINFDKIEVPIDPYYLGIWLGDGTSIETSIHTMDIEIEKYLNEYASNINLICKKFSYKNKHIPELYLYNDKENRLNLLAGILDSDGYIQRNKKNKYGCGFTITQKSEKLIKNIKYLADSLGFKTSLKPIKKRIKKINFEGDYFILNINGNVDIIPVKLKRKQVKVTNRTNHKITGLKVEKLDKGQYFGFVIEGDHLFLLEDCTVTHNTFDVMHTLNDMRIDYIPVAGDISTSGLYEILFKNRNKLIVFDDMDSVYKNEESVNLLKAVLDTQPKRKVSRILKSNFDSFGMDDQEIQKIYNDTGKLPKQFEFTGRIIFITNKPGDKLDQALISRSLFIDINPSIEDVIIRIRNIMPKINPTININMKKEILEFMILMNKKYELNFPINLRTFVHCLNIRLSNDFEMDFDGEKVPVWQMLVKKFLVKK